MALIKLLVAPIRRVVNFPLFQLMAAVIATGFYQFDRVAGQKRGGRESGNGTRLPIREVRASVAIGSKPENICSM